MVVDIAITNQKAGTNLILKDDGKLYYSNKEVLHTGNEGIVNDIGNIYVRIKTTYTKRGILHPGSNLESDLSGTWRSLRVSFASIAGVGYYIQPFVRVALWETKNI